MILFYINLFSGIIVKNFTEKNATQEHHGQFQNIYAEGELQPRRTIRKFQIVQNINIVFVLYSEHQ